MRALTSSLSSSPPPPSGGAFAGPLLPPLAHSIALYAVRVVYDHRTIVYHGHNNNRRWFRSEWGLLISEEDGEEEGCSRWTGNRLVWWLYCVPFSGEWDVKWGGGTALPLLLLLLLLFCGFIGNGYLAVTVPLCVCRSPLNHFGWILFHFFFSYSLSVLIHPGVTQQWHEIHAHYLYEASPLRPGSMQPTK